MTPRKPEPYWNRKTVLTTTAGLVNPLGGSYGIFGYKYGRMAGQTKARAAQEAMQWEGTGVGLSYLGGAAALGLFAPRTFKLAYKGFKAARAGGAGRVKAAWQTAKGLGKVHFPLRKIYKRGGIKLVGRMAIKTAKSHPLFRPYLAYQIGGMAGYSALAPVAAYRWHQQKQKSQRYWVNRGWKSRNG